MPLRDRVRGVGIGSSRGEERRKVIFDNDSSRFDEECFWKISDQNPSSFFFFFLPPSLFPRGAPTMARRLPPSSSLTLLSHLLSRAIDEIVANTAPALRLRPRFFERGWGELNIVDFSKDELVASLSKLSQLQQEKRRCFGAWLDDVARDEPVLEVRKLRGEKRKEIRKRKSGKS